MKSNDFIDHLQTWLSDLEKTASDSGTETPTEGSFGSELQTISEETGTDVPAGESREDAFENQDPKTLTSDDKLQEASSVVGAVKELGNGFPEKVASLQETGNLILGAIESMLANPHVEKTAADELADLGLSGAEIQFLQKVASEAEEVGQRYFETAIAREIDKQALTAEGLDKLASEAFGSVDNFLDKLASVETEEDLEEVLSQIPEEAMDGAGEELAEEVPAEAVEAAEEVAAEEMPAEEALGEEALGEEALGEVAGEPGLPGVEGELGEEEMPMGDEEISEEDLMALADLISSDETGQSQADLAAADEAIGELSENGADEEAIGQALMELAEEAMARSESGEAPDAPLPLADKEASDMSEVEACKHYISLKLNSIR